MDERVAERGMVQHNADQCPSCESSRVEALAEDNGIRRYNCRSCGRNYTAIIGRRIYGDEPGEPVCRLPDDPSIKTPIDDDLKAERKSPFSRTALGLGQGKEAVMAGTVCSKGCGKESGSPAGNAAHERFCDGTAKPEGERRPRRNATRRKPKAKLVRAGKVSGGVISGVLELLKSKRQERVDQIIAQDREILDLDVAIKALEGRPT